MSFSERDRTAPPAAAGPTPPSANAALTGDLIAQTVDMAGIAVWHLDLATDHVSASDELFRILGLEPVPGGVPGARIRAMQHPEDQVRASAFTQALLAGTGPGESVLRYLRADGRCVHLLSRRSVQRDASGRPRALLAVTLDVSERHAQEQRADESARRFALMADATGIGWWAIEGNPPRATFNAELRRMLGLADGLPAPPPKSWVERFVHPADRETLRLQRRQRRAEGRTRAEYSFRLCSADGRTLEVVSQVVFEPAGAPPQRFGVLIDVTERRQAARDLQEARERAALAASGMGVGTWEWFERGDLAHWDDNMFRLRGLPPRAQALSHEERMALVHPDDRDYVSAKTSEALALRQPLALEFRVVWPDGRVRWIATRSLEVLDGATGGLRRIGVNWDVTDGRAAEQARRDAEVALRESQAKSRFLARMSHELRTPLNAVLGFSQLLLAQDAAAPSAAERPGAEQPSHRQALEHIRRAGEHLLHLINDVLDLARIEGGELKLVRERVALEEFARATLPLVALQAHEAGVQVHTGALAEAVWADPTRLRQVLLNLMSNAIKYNRAGGEVRLDAVAAGALVHLRVRDSGRGIAPARLAELFQPFNRLGAEREAIEGTGIGLAIVKSLVERMGGHVQVASEPGVGSLFEVVLPRAGESRPVGTADGTAPEDGPARAPSAPGIETRAGRAAAVAPTDGPAAAPARRRRVLYIEDNAVNALILRELLTTVPGYELMLADDGASGVAQAREHLPELVLLDMQLPDMDGFTVLRHLRELQETAGIPVVALSANVLPDQVNRGLAAGLTDYWTKPLDMQRFLDRLAEVLPPHPAG